MTGISQTLTGLEAPCSPPTPFKPWKPRVWTRRNTPSELRLMQDRRGVLIIPRDDLTYLLNASARDILAWRHQPNFPAERRFGLNSGAVGYARDELISFLKTLPRRDQARVCPALPLGLVNDLGTGLNFRIVTVALRPTIKELLVASAVMIATAVLSFFCVMAAVG